MIILDLNILNKQKILKQLISMFRQLQSQRFKFQVPVVILITAWAHWQIHLANFVQSQIPIIIWIIEKNLRIVEKNAIILIIH